jgi:hypothetical protein
MSMRVDTSSFIAGALVCGDRGLGVLGSSVPAGGESGAGYAYNDLSLPADANKEICGRITSWPAAGSLFAYEDTSFEFTGAPDGRYTFGYTLYVDGVSSGSVVVTLDVGSFATITATLAAAESGADTFAGTVWWVAEGVKEAYLAATETGSDTFYGSGSWMQEGSIWTEIGPTTTTWNNV